MERSKWNCRSCNSLFLTMIKLYNYAKDFKKHHWRIEWLMHIPELAIVNFVRKNTMFKVIFFDCIKVSDWGLWLN